MTKPKDPKAVDQTETETAEEKPEPAETETAAPEDEAGPAKSGEESFEAADEVADEGAAEGAAAETEAEAAPGPDAAPLDEPPQEPTPAAELQEPAQPEEHLEEEAGHRSLAATALMLLVGVLVVVSLTLWAAPKLAPHLPASVAQYLMPGQVDTQAQLAQLEATVAAETAAREAALAAEASARDAAAAAVDAGLAEIAARLDTAGDASAIEAALAAAEAAAEAANAAATDAAALAGRLDAAEAEIATLRVEFAAVSEALAAAATAGSATSAEAAAAIAALAARIDTLSTAVEAGADTGALEQQLAALADRVAAAEASAADARDVQSEALGEVTSALEQARVQGAVDVLASRLTGGLPYGTKLAELAAITGSTPPEALAAGAETGLATADTLQGSFARHAQAAVAEDVRAGTGEGTASRVFGWLRAQVAGRPTSEQKGTDAGAITSRIAARIEEGKLAEALAEADTLSAPAQEGLGSWLDRLRARVAAETALGEWRAASGAGG